MFFVFMSKLLIPILFPEKEKTDIYLQNLSLVLYPEDLLRHVELYCCF